MRNVTRALVSALVASLVSGAVGVYAQTATEADFAAVRGSALLSVQLLSKDAPGVVNAIRPLLHTMATTDGNQAVRRLAVLCLRNGSPQRETIVLLTGLADDDEQEQELRNAARTVAGDLRKRAGPRG